MNNLLETIRQEATDTSDQVLSKYAEVYVANSRSLTDILEKILASQFCDQYLGKENLLTLFRGKLDEVEIEQDINAFYKRDFACRTYIEVLLLNRGFHALMAFRISHKMWKHQEYFSAKWLNNQISKHYGVDIHPAAEIGRGLVMDHCMGIVIGETCKIESDVFLFHNVTLGGTGHSGGERHPKIKSNVVIGTGATILGNIVVGENSVVAAGSVVLDDVSPGMLVAGMPASPKGHAKKIQEGT